ncbi:MAG: hypothetical protein GY793_06935 [Proteobacteria bacterium]|nr:hypothetical protein [Pseudomonadota bacterium]
MQKLLVIFISLVFITSYSYASNHKESFKERIINRIENLNSCTKYTKKYKNTLTRTTETYKILGSYKNKCITIETMPGGFTIKCAYPKSVLKNLSNYLKELSSAKKISVKVRMSDKGISSNESIDNGEGFQNPFEKYVNDKNVCIITNAKGDVL